jgi:hypothetical protein
MTVFGGCCRVVSLGFITALGMTVEASGLWWEIALVGCGIGTIAARESGDSRSPLGMTSKKSNGKYGSDR